MKVLSSLLISVFILQFNFTIAQINLDRKIRNEANHRANKNVDQGINKSFDAMEAGVKDLFRKKKSQDQNPVEKDTESPAAEEIAQNKEADDKKSQNLQSYSKYDFVPGEKLIFFDDFSQDAVGDFPALWNTNGSAEVVTTNLYPGNWMKFVMHECVWTDELLKLSDNYTVEFDVIPIGGLEGDRMSGYIVRLMQAENVKAWDGGSTPGNGGFSLTVEYFGRPGYNTWFAPGKDECNLGKISGFNENEGVKQLINIKYHIAIWVQKSRIRVYQDEIKLFDLPRALPSGCINPDRLRFEYGAAMLSNVRIAVGTPDTRNKLITDGKLVSYGIYFDVNKDIVKPESYGTLKEIAKILNEVPEVRVKILGHTDADGLEAANLDLSERRAASVKAELVKLFGVNADRIETGGMGETQPMAPNDTPTNKALNRRVEFIKL